MSRVTAIFVTATGTDIGKTFVTTGLIRHWQAAGKTVAAIKPVASGYDPAQAAASDPGVLATALGRPVSETEIEKISPWRFRAPLAPDLAAAREGRSIDFNALVEFCRQEAARSPGTLLIEGVGGVMVALDDRHTVLDWITMLRFPLLVVTGSYLGSMSHTLTALHVLAQRKLDIAAVVVDESPASPVAMNDTVGTLARFTDIPIIALPRLPADVYDHAAFESVAALL